MSQIKKHYIQCSTNIFLQKLYGLVKINSIYSKMWQGIKNKYLCFQVKIVWDVSQLLRWKKVKEHICEKLGAILNLRCLAIYLSIFSSTLMSKYRAQDNVCDLIQI